MLFNTTKNKNKKYQNTKKIKTTTKKEKKDS